LPRDTHLQYDGKKNLDARKKLWRAEGKNRMVSLAADLPL
jgi:hypothetical protein